jgi:SpoVK/Ycf46/Vps4 family AAA+-type ATPase
VQILGVHLQRRGLPLADDVSIEEIATMTMGFTGADLANLVNEVGTQAACWVIIQYRQSGLPCIQRCTCTDWECVRVCVTIRVGRAPALQDSRMIWLCGCCACCCVRVPLLQAALLAGRTNKALVGREEFSAAVLRSVAGIEKKRSILQGMEKEVVARHEVRIVPEHNSCIMCLVV